jgi:hypothetical protein
MDKGHIVVPKELKDRLDIFYLSVPKYRGMSKELFYSMIVEYWIDKESDNAKKAD